MQIGTCELDKSGFFHSSVPVLDDRFVYVYTIAGLQPIGSSISAHLLDVYDVDISKGFSKAVLKVRLQIVGVSLMHSL